MNYRILIFVILIAFSLLLVCNPVSSGECPAGSDCFLCGGVGGIPCTTNCQGVWDPILKDYVSCRCPQGKACECYCPYVPTSTPTKVPIRTTSTSSPLVARISTYQRDQYAPSMVEFSDESTGAIESRLWDFGDNQRTSQLKFPTIIFSEPGSYVVTLTVVDAVGNKATDIVTITVLPKPITELVTDDEKESSSIPLPLEIIFGAIISAAFLIVIKTSK